MLVCFVGDLSLKQQEDIVEYRCNHLNRGRIGGKEDKPL